MANEHHNPNPLTSDIPEVATSVMNIADPAENAAPEDIAQIKQVLEAALLAASEPMSLNELRKLFDGKIDAETLRILLDELASQWADRSAELTLVASGYRFRIKPAYQKYLDRLHNEKPPKYSRAVMETLAIIAYRQPVTRSDIEDIRGVSVSPHILKTLEDRGWVDEIGHREVAGRPALFATTKHFLDDLNLRSLEELPPLHELQATLDMTQAGAAWLAPSAQKTTVELPGLLPSAGDDNHSIPESSAMQESAATPVAAQSSQETP